MDGRLKTTYWSKFKFFRIYKRRRWGGKLNYYML